VSFTHAFLEPWSISYTSFFTTVNLSLIELFSSMVGIQLKLLIRTIDHTYSLTLIALNLKMECSNFEIRPGYMNFLGNFCYYSYITNRVDHWSEGSSRSPLIWVYTVFKGCLNSVPALQVLRQNSTVCTKHSYLISMYIVLLLCQKSWYCSTWHIDKLYILNNTSSTRFKTVANRFGSTTTTLTDFLK